MEEEEEEDRQQLMLIVLEERRNTDHYRFLRVEFIVFLTIVQVLLDVDIVEEEIEEFCIEILEFVDKLDLVIPSMDILDRITRTKA